MLNLFRSISWWFLLNGSLESRSLFLHHSRTHVILKFFLKSRGQIEVSFCANLISFSMRVWMKVFVMHLKIDLQWLHPVALCKIRIGRMTFVVLDRSHVQLLFPCSYILEFLGWGALQFNLSVRRYLCLRNGICSSLHGTTEFEWNSYCFYFLPRYHVCHVCLSFFF